MSVFGPIVLKKSKYPLDPISAAGAFSERGCGGLVIHARLNGNRSESICGVNQRRSKMSLVFRQIRNDFTLATFSTESDPKLTCTVLANVCFEGEERRCDLRRRAPQTVVHVSFQSDSRAKTQGATVRA
jgi:hypothetical protein